jgi:hypothetical protein
MPRWVVTYHECDHTFPFTEIEPAVIEQVYRYPYGVLAKPTLLGIFARVRSDRDAEHGRAIARTTAKRYCPIVCLALLAKAWAFSYSLNAQESETSAPNLDLILDNLERTEQQNAALSRPYEVARKYILFRRDDRKPSSEVTAQISFTPPNMKTFNITEEHGNPRGKKIVRDVLEQEIASTKAGHESDVSRSNYDFVFLREENFGAVPEYVLHIIPKRQEKGLAARRHLGGCQDLPHSADCRNPAQESLFLDQGPPHHPPIRHRERHVDVHFCGRNCDGPVARHLHPVRS